ncbi:MAG: hypothetical protein A4E57_03476 [Syntrophorhabdaceae bacterium PtaU1.Bin034]|nr:MAG: hypothetical protein A4E57_03476 [Syntrophorhabdaceae bacterium PtaU1.Bin034]
MGWHGRKEEERLSYVLDPAPVEEEGKTAPGPILHAVGIFPGCKDGLVVTACGLDVEVGSGGARGPSALDSSDKGLVGRAGLFASVKGEDHHVCRKGLIHKGVNPRLIEELRPGPGDDSQRDLFVEQPQHGPAQGRQFRGSGAEVADFHLFHDKFLPYEKKELFCRPLRSITTDKSG